MRQDVKERIEKVERGIVPNDYVKTAFGIHPKSWKQFKIKEIFSKVGIPVTVEPDKKYETVVDVE